MFYVGAIEKGRTDMSTEETFWISLAEKFFGLMLTIIGALFLYFTISSTSVLGMFTAFFGLLAIVVLVAGLFLLLVRPPE
jgi:hypothetical protein